MSNFAHFPKCIGWFVAFQTIISIVFTPSKAMAQKDTSVHGIETFVVSINDNITLYEAKNRCIQQAKQKAILNAFGQTVMVDQREENTDKNGVSSNTYIDLSHVSAIGKWLSDEKEPVINVEYIDGKLYFTAEVWGKAREVNKASTNFLCQVLKDLDGKKVKTNELNSGERVFIRFSTPADGYVAVYLMVEDNAYCLLPYAKDSDGMFLVKAGSEYVFFDKETDRNAKYYTLKTDKPLEQNDFFIIYSPHHFTKCNDQKGGDKKPNGVSLREFNKWLNRCQSLDKDMVVEQKTVKIYNHQIEQ